MAERCPFSANKDKPHAIDGSTTLDTPKDHTQTTPTTHKVATKVYVDYSVVVVASWASGMQLRVR
jgi:hypothetical protein